MVRGMIPLTPESTEDERNSILAVLGNLNNIEHAINNMLDDPTERFYVVELDFWTAWVDNV